MNKKHIDVDLIFLSKLSDMTGLSTVIRNILIGFKGHSTVNLKVWADGSKGVNSLDISHSSHDKINNIKTGKFKKNVRLILDFFAKKSGLVALLIIFLTYFKNAKKVVKTYDGNGDLIFFHEIFTPYIFYKLKRKDWDNKRKVIVLHCDGDPVRMLFGYYPMLQKNIITKKFFSRLLRVILKDVETIVLLGRKSLQRFNELYPEYKNKSVIVPNGLQDFQEPLVKSQVKSSVIKIVTVGTVGIRKGHDLLIDAINKMSEDERKKFELHIVGNGDIKNSLEEICNKKQLNNIIFHGGKTNVIPYLTQSDVFILASRDEGLPMAIIEGMRASLPIIATNVGDCSDLIINDNGWLIEPNVNDIMSTLRLVLSDNYLVERGQYSRKLYESEYSIDAMINNYHNIFYGEK